MWDLKFVSLRPFLALDNVSSVLLCIHSFIDSFVHSFYKLRVCEDDGNSPRTNFSACSPICLPLNSVPLPVMGINIQFMSGIFSSLQDGYLFLPAARVL